MELYTGEQADLIREHGWVKAAQIIAERKKQPAPEPTQGDASELSEADWKAAIEANKRKASGS